MSIAPNPASACKARRLPPRIYDEFKRAMFDVAFKIRLGDWPNNRGAAFALAIIDSRDRKTTQEMTGFYLWFKAYWLPRRYAKLLKSIRRVQYQIAKAQGEL